MALTINNTERERRAKIINWMGKKRETCVLAKRGYSPAVPFSYRTPIVGDSVISGAVRWLDLTAG